MTNAGLRDEEKIKDGIRRADFVRKGMQIIVSPRESTEPNYN